MSAIEIEDIPAGILKLQLSLDVFPTHDVSYVGAYVLTISTVSQLLQSLADDD